MVAARLLRCFSGKTLYKLDDFGRQCRLPFAAALKLTGVLTAVVAARLLRCFSGKTLYKLDDFDRHRSDRSKSLFYPAVLRAKRKSLPIQIYGRQGRIFMFSCIRNAPQESSRHHGGVDSGVKRTMFRR